jgi:8-oxo-dGTP diphosphatase
MTLYLVRHAVAKSRRSWHDNDQLRPLTPKGERQAIGLADLLHDGPIKRVLSSPAVRCAQTVTPLAKKLGLSVETTDALQEGAPFAKAWDLLLTTAHKKGDAVLCAHGDLIPELVDAVGRSGAKTDPPHWAKGSIWGLEWDGHQFTSARYTPPQSG